MSPKRTWALIGPDRKPYESEVPGTAIAAGYRPGHCCMPEEYRAWKSGWSS